MTDTARPRGRNPRALLNLWPYVRPQRALALGWLVFLGLSSGSTLALPYGVRLMIDHGFSHGDPAALNRSFALLFAIALLLALATAGRYFCISLLGERAITALRDRLYAHLIGQDVSFFERLRVGEVISRLGTDTQVVQDMLGSGVSVALRSSVTLLGSAALMVWTQPRLAGLTALVIPGVILPILVFGRRVQKLSRSNQDRIADTAAIANETLNAASTVKAYARERIESGRYRDALLQALRSAQRRIGTRAGLTATVIVLVFGAVTLVLWTGAHEVVAGQLSAGVLGQFVLYAVFAAGSVGALAETWGEVQRAAGAMQRIDELLAEQPQVVAPAQPRRLPVPARGIVDFSEVTFHYPTRPDAPALHGFTLNVRPGETVALVGPSGAGKTTVLQLLLRFYDPQQGRVALDGMDLRELDPVELRGRIALVPQEPVIFHASAADNIRFGRPDADEAAVIAAARAAEADGFIRDLPQGYAMPLGERGARLSGGQKQRIAIARALLKNAPVLLLDEATASLDAQSEAAIQKALARLHHGQTTLVIAHRLATVQRADRIVVMDAGRIVAEGTHEALLAQGGLYADLARLQLLA
ncbi:MULTISPECIES: ABC transporter transmembrane domain-containing protein [Metallibacterium]|jgi:ATP-binding cassette subfamily B protein|uniref:ABC transporter transmembrane domain-containing protein n=1 Tax=Metallibacterium TaxID=1218803 RepID=UPI002621564A|nr:MULTISPECIES: ABC transporter transmembrane domain-containing protein [Metallibacterium]MBW8074822.1 ATP-binding cassette domain-containing protein [Metallibacterium scheffleri]